MEIEADKIDAPEDERFPSIRRNILSRHLDERSDWNVCRRDNQGPTTMLSGRRWRTFTQEAKLIEFRLNGKPVSSDAPEEADLLYVLLNDFRLSGAKLGCGRSQCGACTVLVDGEPIRSCVTPTKAVRGLDVTTLEGLQVDGKPSRLQQAFIAEQAAQCGYCISGMIVEAHALLERNPNPTDADVRSALNGNLCRCGTHNRIVRAVLRAAGEV
jgi:nicotinate dehydrogenase subunit A